MELVRMRGPAPYCKFHPTSLRMETNKLKVLCFHGFRQNANVFRKKLGCFRKMLKPHVDFTFLDAPHIPPPTDDDPTLEDDMADEEERSWWFTGPNQTYVSKEPTDTDEGFDESIEALKNHLRECGPYDGVVGFSQGAAFTAIVCHLSQNNELPCKFRFAILVSGFKSLCSKHAKFYEKKLDLHTLHVIGETDEVISMERSLAILECFKSPQVLIHSGGHYVPASKQYKNTYIDFIKQFTNK